MLFWRFALLLLVTNFGISISIFTTTTTTTTTFLPFLSSSLPPTTPITLITTMISPAMFQSQKDQQVLLNDDDKDQQLVGAFRRPSIATTMMSSVISSEEEEEEEERQMLAVVSTTAVATLKRPRRTVKKPKMMEDEELPASSSSTRKKKKKSAPKKKLKANKKSKTTTTKQKMMKKPKNGSKPKQQKTKKNQSTISISTISTSEAISADVRALLPSDFQPNESTVVLGRGNKSIQCEGNRRLKEFSNRFLHDYSIAITKKQKSDIVQAIVDRVRQQGYNNSSSNNGDPQLAFVRFQGGRYWSATEKDLREKITAYFRDKLFPNYKSSSKSKTARRQHLVNTGVLPSKTTTASGSTKKAKGKTNSSSSSKQQQKKTNLQKQPDIPAMPHLKVASSSMMMKFPDPLPCLSSSSCRTQSARSVSLTSNNDRPSFLNPCHISAPYSMNHNNNSNNNDPMNMMFQEVLGNDPFLLADDDDDFCLDLSAPLPEDAGTFTAQQIFDF